MPVAGYIKETMTSKGAGVIRKMFEEGLRLKKNMGMTKFLTLVLEIQILIPLFWFKKPSYRKLQRRKRIFMDTCLMLVIRSHGKLWQTRPLLNKGFLFLEIAL